MNILDELKTELAEIKQMLKEKQEQPLPQVRLQEDLITREKAAELLDITYPTLRQWTRKGKLNAWVLAGRVYYKRSEIEKSLLPLNGKAA